MGNIAPNRSYDVENHKRDFKDTPYCNSFISGTEGEHYAKFCCLNDYDKMNFWSNCSKKRNIFMEWFMTFIYNTGCSQTDTDFAKYKSDFNCNTFLEDLRTKKDLNLSSSNFKIFLFIIIVIILIVLLILVNRKKKNPS